MLDDILEAIADALADLFDRDDRRGPARHRKARRMTVFEHIKLWTASRWLDLRSRLPGYGAQPEPSPLDGLPPADADDPPEVNQAREDWVGAQLAFIDARMSNDVVATEAARRAIDETRAALDAAKARHGFI